MDLAFTASASAEITGTVEPHMSALSVGSGELDVLSTPWMIALMEAASLKAVKDSVPPGFTTVGTHIQVCHSAPIPTGSRYTVESSLIETRGRILVFRVKASSGLIEVGAGFHRRALVETEGFLNRARKGGP